MKAMEEQLAKMSLHNKEADESKDDLIRRLQGLSIFSVVYLFTILLDEVNQWKQKYEALAKLYAQLRKEHLELLAKYRELKESQGKAKDDAMVEVEKIKSELKVNSWIAFEFYKFSYPRPKIWTIRI